MGNANGREEGEGEDYDLNDNSNSKEREGEGEGGDEECCEDVGSSDSMCNSPPESPSRSRSPLMFTPQLPVAPLQRGDGHPPYFNDMWGGAHKDDSPPPPPPPPHKGIPCVITWCLPADNVAVEGSWDNWTSRKTLQRSGKDHTLLLVLPSGIYHYSFIIDGQTRYMPDLPHLSTHIGQLCNVLDVHDNVPESLDSVTEFEPPLSPGSSYGHAMPGEDDFAKEPVMVPPQLHLTVLGMQNTDEVPSRPQHVVLNHLFIEKGLAAAQSVVALGLTHRFESKYVTVVLYKPLRR